MAPSKARLPLETFDIPVHKLRQGSFSAKYFVRTKELLEALNYSRTVLMQVFQKKDAVLCGTDEVIAVLKLCSGYYIQPEKAKQLFKKWEELDKKIRNLNYMSRIIPVQELVDAVNEQVQLEIRLDSLWVNVFERLDVRALRDGWMISPWETVMTIKGPPQYFTHLESIYLGILARSTMVATNVRKVVEAAQGKPVLFFADRFDHYKMQPNDGYAATIGGVQAVATDAHGEWTGKEGSGTMPHALIACFDGNTVWATRAFAMKYPDVPCISLVDFGNDCVKTALEVADHFRLNGWKLWGVRLDTSENMVDQSLTELNRLGSDKPTGVNPILVNNVRRVLDSHGHQDVKIVVSGGFTAEKIEYFEKNKIPVDAYGCGSSLIKDGGDFTADIVKIDGKPCAKKGRRERPNVRLQLVQ
ncbi:MAG: quinolinate phosphoribosyl transferase [Candidatus Yanofskybacteria bacterium]|nr:quinolinate phosphoribosyl transferase [Candidatus Yanofskybacteria bacterium]